MKKLPKLLKIGLATVALGVLLRVYNFFNMYNLATDCPANNPMPTCQAQMIWNLIDATAGFLIVCGLALVVLALLSRHKNK